MIKKLKNNLIYAPRLFYFLVFVYAWIVFRKDFYISMPPKKIKDDSTHFIFVLADKKVGEKYLVKFRNFFSDIYFKNKTEVNRLSQNEYINLIKHISNLSFISKFLPEIKIYNNHVLWQYLENALPIDSDQVRLALEEKKVLKNEVRAAIGKLKEQGIIYGKVRGHHIMVEQKNNKKRIVLVDWDTARYV